MGDGKWKFTVVRNPDWCSKHRTAPFEGDSPQNQVGKIHGKVCGQDALTQQGFTFPNAAQGTEPHTDSVRNLFNRANFRGEKWK